MSDETAARAALVADEKAITDCLAEFRHEHRGCFEKQDMAPRDGDVSATSASPGQGTVAPPQGDRLTTIERDVYEEAKATAKAVAFWMVIIDRLAPNPQEKTHG